MKAGSKAIFRRICRRESNWVAWFRASIIVQPFFEMRPAFRRHFVPPVHTAPGTIVAAAAGTETGGQDVGPGIADKGFHETDLIGAEGDFSNREGAAFIGLEP